MVQRIAPEAGAQQAPVGPEFAQMFAVSQLVLGPRQTPFWAEHSAAVRTWQVTPAAAAMQHAPLGDGQRVGEHWEPLPW